ncbi:hypothetical protein IscW_ISCW002604 [Ixodes scapularis]|uniref:Uncharacterized protein n=1 Tax=Ixodes scapularis TaxID=6945 RepID=B7PCJ3_IXOSC|nr:hypothetical protein IscW_ISCW002604 [Ixodes scapularis]|eukprot:XP_002409921.1 hypothetical protein IscW_ISCW002604 [Ixodes scapularis]
MLAKLSLRIDNTFVTCPYHYVNEYPITVSKTWRAKGSCDASLALRKYCPRHDSPTETVDTREAINFIHHVLKTHACITHVTLHSAEVSQCLQDMPLGGIRSVNISHIDEAAVAILTRSRNILERLVIRSRCFYENDAVVRQLISLLNDADFPSLKVLSVSDYKVVQGLCLKVSATMFVLSHINLPAYAYKNLSGVGDLDIAVVNYIDGRDGHPVCEPEGVLDVLRNVEELILHYYCDCNNIVDLNLSRPNKSKTAQLSADLCSLRDYDEETLANSILVRKLKIESAMQCMVNCTRFRNAFRLAESTSILVYNEFFVKCDVDASGLVKIWNFATKVMLKKASLVLSKVLMGTNAGNYIIQINKALNGRLTINNFVWCYETLASWCSLKTARNIAITSDDMSEVQSRVCCIMQASQCNSICLSDLDRVTDLHVVFGNNDSSLHVELFLRMPQLQSASIYTPPPNLFVTTQDIVNYRFKNFFVFGIRPHSVQEVESLASVIVKTVGNAYVGFHNETPTHLVATFYKYVIETMDKSPCLIRLIVDYAHSFPDYESFHKRIMDACEQNRHRIYDGVRYLLYRDPTYAYAYIQCVGNGAKRLIRDIVSGTF